MGRLEDWQVSAIDRAVLRSGRQVVEPLSGTIGRRRTYVLLSWEDVKVLVRAAEELVRRDRPRRRAR